jgi:hypothetical protein
MMENEDLYAEIDRLDSLQTSVRVHANIAVDHLARHISPAAD